MKLKKKHFLFFLTLGLISLIASSGLFAQEADEFFKSVMRNDIKAVKEAIASGADIDVQDKTYGHTPLIVACNYNYVEMAKLLISEGADIHIRGKDGSTALIAAGSNSQELVELLLSKGADVHAKMNNGTGVFSQCINGILMEQVPLKLAAILLSNGADVDESPATGVAQGVTPLMTAARNDNEKLVQFLIEHGADVNAKSADGSTALSLATKEGDQKIIDVLKENGAK